MRGAGLVCFKAPYFNIELLFIRVKIKNIYIQNIFDYSDEIKTQTFLLIENAVKFLHTSVDVWSGDRLARRRSLVQTPLEGAKISAF